MNSCCCIDNIRYCGVGKLHNLTFHSFSSNSWSAIGILQQFECGKANKSRAFRIIEKENYRQLNKLEDMLLPGRCCLCFTARINYSLVVYL